MERNLRRFFFGLVLIVLIYSGFFTYFCMAKPVESNNSIEQVETKTVKGNSTFGNDKQNERKATAQNTVKPEVYLSKMIEFYQQIISILFFVIGVLLATSFSYVYFASKRQTEEMVREALKEEDFARKLDDIVTDRFIKSKNEGDVGDIFELLEGVEEKLSDVDERLGFLEEEITAQSYDDSSSEEIDEGIDGDN